MSKYPKYLILLIAVVLVAVYFAGCTSAAPAPIAPIPTPEIRYVYVTGTPVTTASLESGYSYHLQPTESQMTDQQKAAIKKIQQQSANASRGLSAEGLTIWEANAAQGQPGTLGYAGNIVGYKNGKPIYSGQDPDTWQWMYR